jgi:HD-GYP domain-containing protein (c-di-GMP phosphodiesterase class II)
VADETEGGQDVALTLCNLYMQALRLIRLYEIDNVAFEAPLQQMAAIINKTTEKGGSVRIQADEGMLYYNKEPLRGGRRAFGTIQGLFKGLEQLNVAEVAFLQAVDLPLLRAYFGAFKKALEADDPAEAVQKELEQKNLKSTMGVYRPGETTGQAIAKKLEIDEKTYFPLAYARTLVLLREYVKNLRNEELNRYFSQKLQRSLQDIVGLTAKYFNRWLSLTAIKGADDYLFNHMANTGILSILLGHNVGLGKVKLTELAYCAMLHGLGPFRSSPELVERAELDAEEQAELGKHPYRAIGAHIEGKKVTNKMLAAAAVGFQYDLHRGNTPLRIPPTETHPYARIVRICEAYDALTSPRPDRPAMLPDQALKVLIEAKTGHYDPLLLTVFTNMMGLFPTGTTVTLSSGEVAVVVHPNPDSPRRPLVAIVRGREGQPVDGDFLDLGMKLENGQYPCTITGSVDPRELGIVVPEHLLA